MPWDPTSGCPHQVGGGQQEFQSKDPFVTGPSSHGEGWFLRGLLRWQLRDVRLSGLTGGKDAGRPGFWSSSEPDAWRVQSQVEMAG